LSQSNATVDPNHASVRSDTVPKFEMPPSLVILATILVLAAIATLIFPPGEYERIERNFPNWITHTVVDGDTLQTIAKKTGAEEIALSDLRSSSDPSGPVESLSPGMTVLVPVGGLSRSAVVPGTYKRLSSEGRESFFQSIFSRASDVARAPIMGFVDKAQIIGFVLLVGGSFGVILSTGAVDQCLGWVVLRMGKGRAKWAVIPVSFTLFSLGGAVYGMGEDTIAFVLITIPFAIRLGYDTITGVAMCYMASQVGFAGAFFNPFTVGIAQGIAELPYLSGLNFRYVVWTVVTLIGIAFTMWWARRVERDPKRSPTFAIDEAHRGRLSEATSDGLFKPTFGQCCVVAVAFGSVFISGYGVAKHGWFINEMSAMFLTSAMICGALTRYSPRRVSQEFIRGASQMAEPGLIIACSAGVMIVLQQGQVLDTILYGLASSLETVSPGLAAVAMMCVQAVLNFFVPSGSGQAAMTMPIITPLCDLIGIERQVGVLAFQFGDGFGNLIIPTSAVLMGVLGAARIPWLTWIRWVAPLVIVLHLVGAIFLVIATHAPASWLQ
jgi:uncharacterized ion transporter superfamily protein YfcC